ncbi:hypothetical protein JHK87_056795 [Glycine soja]|nr:hypothetical protein JHK87_056795 [Glycine soja]
MSSLIILDIANNTISGHIPTCLHNITALVFNNASLNKLSFEFPTIDTLGIVDNPYYALVDSLELVTKGQVKYHQGFSALSYVGNRDLCGPPLTKICFQGGKPNNTEPIDEDGDEFAFLSWLYIGIESGFATGFLGFCCVIFLIRKWRHAYFKFRPTLCHGGHQNEFFSLRSDTTILVVDSESIEGEDQGTQTTKFLEGYREGRTIKKTFSGP